MNIVFDCDGIILDFSNGFCDYYEAKNYTQKYGSISRQPKTWNFDFTGDPKIFPSIIKEFIDTRPSLSFIPGFDPTILKILKTKYPIYIVSHYHDDIGRFENLSTLGIQKGIHYDELYCMPTRKEKINKIKELKPRYYIEDSPDIVNTLIAADFEKTIFVPSYEYCNSVKDDTSVKRYAEPKELLTYIP